MISAHALHWNHVVWPIAGGFRISRGEKHHADVIEVNVFDCTGHAGRAECVPYARYGESLQSVGAQLDELAPHAADGLEFAHLNEAPPGAARNAVDCAMWDLWAQTTGKSVRKLAGLPAFTSCISAYTLSLDEPEAMAAKAAKYSNRPLLKLKLAGDGKDKSRLHAIHAARPDAKLILDGNEGFTAPALNELIPVLSELPVATLEQPMPEGKDDQLAGLELPFPICADESLHVTDDLPALRGKYQMVNVKLDKTGGLTEALKLISAAKAQGIGIMVGCMVGSSLAMAPALVLAGQADLIDLDGPLLLENDHAHGLQYQGSRIVTDATGLWGYPREPVEG